MNQRRCKLARLWQDDYANALLQQLRYLLADTLSSLADVTIVCEEKLIRAHKVILAASSPHFKQLLAENPCKHPIIMIQDAKVEYVQKIVDFLYSGEVNIPDDQVKAFLKLAQSLKITGLAYVKEHNDTSSQMCDGVSHVVSSKTNVEMTRQEQSVSTASSEWSILPWELLHGTEQLEAVWHQVTEPLPSSCLDPPPSCLQTLSPMTVRCSQTDEEMVIQQLEQEASSLIQPTHFSSQPTWAASSAVDDAETMSTPCKFCKRTFNTGRLLELHLRQFHNSKSEITKPHICKTCGKSYVQKWDLLKHERNIHGDFSIKRTCPYCHKTFKHKLSLDTHVKTYHTGKNIGQTFTCSICDKNFTLKTKLQRHIRSVHSAKNSGDGGHRCDMCNKNFKYKTSLQHHNTEHHSGKLGERHACKLCNKTYRWPSDLRKHERKAHYAVE